MTTLPNVGLTGALRSGKDTVAAYLTQKYGHTSFAFGDELKRYAHEIFDVPETPKPRELYQWFGQTMRERDPDVWVRKCFETIAEEARKSRIAEKYHGGPAFRAVISDVRQPNEFGRCRAQGYVIIRVKAQSALRIHRAIESADTFNLADLAHDTESHVDSFRVDAEITNDTTLDELYTQIDAIMAEIAR